MSVFTPAEIAYLQSQPLGRLATVGPDGQPHVVPIGFRYNPDEDAIDSGGLDIAATKKYRDILANRRVAFVVDDLASVDPWRVRGVEVRGEAEILMAGGAEFGAALGANFAEDMFRIRPRRIIGWGIDGDAFTANARSVT
jgi:pyridoxamine 5'-phosphate oxidase family protein